MANLTNLKTWTYQHFFPPKSWREEEWQKFNRLVHHCLEGINETRWMYEHGDISRSKAEERLGYEGSIACGLIVGEFDGFLTVERLDGLNRFLETACTSGVLEPDKEMLWSDEGYIAN